MILDSGLGRENDGGAYRKPAGGLGAHQGTVYVVCGCSGQGGFFDFPRHPAKAVNLSGFGSRFLAVAERLDDGSRGLEPTDAGFSEAGVVERRSGVWTFSGTMRMHPERPDR